MDEVHRGGPGSHHRPLTVRRLIALFVLAGMVALSTAVSVTAWASRRSGLTQATREARQTTWLIAVGIVEPAITPGVLQRDAAALDALHELVSARVLNDSLLRVKIWAADGTVLYSNDSRLIGEQFSFDEAELAILRDGGTNAGISDMRAPENGLEDTSIPQLEVYTRINGPDGEPLLFEALQELHGATGSSTSVANLCPDLVERPRGPATGPGTGGLASGSSLAPRTGRS